MSNEGKDMVQLVRPLTVGVALLITILAALVVPATAAPEDQIAWSAHPGLCHW